MAVVEGGVHDEADPPVVEGRDERAQARVAAQGRVPTSGKSMVSWRWVEAERKIGLT